MPAPVEAAPTRTEDPMRGPPSRLTRYFGAIAATAIVVMVRYALAPVLGDTAPFIPFVIAVMVSAWYGGLGPGLLATALSGAASTYLFIPPYYSFQMTVSKSISRKLRRQLRCQ